MDFGSRYRAPGETKTEDYALDTDVIHEVDYSPITKV
jgi:hypothetical protein